MLACMYAQRADLAPKRPRLTPGDAEVFDRLEAFAYGQLPADSELEDRTRALTMLAVLCGMGAEREFARVLPKALELGLAPEEVKEVVYQATAYLGTGRALPLLEAANEVLAQAGIVTSDVSRLTDTPDTRREAGTAHQMALWGEAVADFYTRSHMNYLVCTHIFGDYYARECLSDADRALVTFCFLYAMGGVDHELAGYIKGNIGAGNSPEMLEDVIYQNIPYVGFPRSLSALSVLKSVTDK